MRRQDGAYAARLGPNARLCYTLRDGQLTEATATLYGHAILRVSGREVVFDNCGFATRLTLKYMNKAGMELGLKCYIRQQKREWAAHCFGQDFTFICGQCRIARTPELETIRLLTEDIS